MTWRDAGSKPALMATERPFGMGGFELPQPFCADSTITAFRLVALAKPHFGEDRLLGIVRDPQIFMQRCRDDIASFIRLARLHHRGGNAFADR